MNGAQATGIKRVLAGIGDLYELICNAEDRLNATWDEERDGYECSEYKALAGLEKARSSIIEAENRLNALVGR